LRLLNCSVAYTEKFHGYVSVVWRLQASKMKDTLNNMISAHHKLKSFWGRNWRYSIQS